MSRMLRWLRRPTSTIAGSILLLALTAHARPERSAAFVPTGTPVDPSQVQALSLEQLLVFGDAYSPAIQTARARIAMAEAPRADAETLLPSNPVVGLSVGPRVVAGEAGLDYEISVQQAVEISGARALRLTAIDAARQTALASVNEVRWQTHVTVHRLFVDLLLAAERRAQAQQFVDFSASLREVARRQVEAGESSELILLVADADLAQTRESLINTAQSEASIRAQLAATIGWPNHALPKIHGTLPPIRRAPSTTALLTQMASHPILRTRALALEALQADATRATREAWPVPSFGLSYAHEAAPGTGPEANVWLLNLSLPIPVWRTNQSGQAAADAALQVAHRQRDEAHIALRGALVQAALALNTAADRVALYAASVQPRLRANLALLERAYSLGEIDVHQVSLTRQRLLDVSRRALDARITYYENTATLEGLVGAELWTTPEPAP